MGLTFRSGDYIRFVHLGGRTIKSGEAAAIWNRKGIHTEIIGPKRVNLFFSTIRFLTRHKAESQQYLVVRHRNGCVEHIRGPSSIYENPSFHDEVSVQTGIFLKSSSEFVIVYNDGTSEIDPKNSDGELNFSMKMYKIHGPTLFIPKPSEHIHEFSWSRIDRERLNSDAMKFSILCTSLYSMNISLKIPLSNNNHVSVELHVEYKIAASSSVEILMKYDDPIARMHNAILADGQVLSDKITLDMVNAWDQEKMDSIFKNLSSYNELTKTAEQSGIQIISVSLTGHSLNNQLESLFNKERALSLELTSELKAKTQRQQLRTIEEEEKMKEIEVAAKLKRAQIESDDRLEKEMHSKKIDSLKRKAEVDTMEAKALNDVVKMKDEQVLEFFKAVKGMDVDMTKFLCSFSGSENNRVNSNSIEGARLMKDWMISKGGFQ